MAKGATDAPTPRPGSLPTTVYAADHTTRAASRQLIAYGESLMNADTSRSGIVRSKSSRRQFLQRSGGVIAGSLLAAAVVPKVHAAEENTIRLALIGCGGRGSGAVGDACSRRAGSREAGGHGRCDRNETREARTRRSARCSPRTWMFRPNGSSLGSMPIARRSTAWSQVTWRCSRATRDFGPSSWNTPCPTGSTCSWRSRLPPIRPVRDA